MAQAPPPPPPPPPAWGAPPAWPMPPGAGWAGAPGPMLPGSGRFRAQGVGQLLDSAFTLYRRNFLLVMAIAAVAQVPVALARYLAFALTGAADGAQQLAQFGQQSQGLPPDQVVQQLQNLLTNGHVEQFYVVAGGGAILGIFLGAIAMAAMTRAVSDLYREETTGVGVAYRAFLHAAPSVLGASALVTGAVVSVCVAGFLLSLLAVVTLGAAGLVLLLVIFPAVVAALLYLYARWAFVQPVVMNEGLTARAALRRSSQLVRGATWRVLGIRLLVLLVAGVLSSIIGGLLTLFTQFGSSATQLALSQLAQLVAAVVIEPITLITVVLLYYDQRIRREAFDIEMLASTL